LADGDRGDRGRQLRALAEVRGEARGAALRPRVGGDPGRDPDRPAMKPLSLVAPDGARVLIQPIGAQVASWIPAGGSERFFTASNAPVGTAAVKGGIPVCFPQFASQGP